MEGAAVLPVKTSGTRLLAAAALVVGIFVFSLQDLILKLVSRCRCCDLLVESGSIGCWRFLPRIPTSSRFRNRI